jgi:cytoskeletal protein RodZ
MAKSLKEQREKLGRELKEVARITRIKASYLKAIEEEDFAKLPVEVYTKGYIREYAKFLGYPSDAAIAPYEAYLEEIKGGKEKNLADIPSDEKTSDNIPSESIEKTPSFKSESLDYSQESQEISIEKGVSGVRGFSQRILVAVSIAGIALLIYLLLPGGKSAPPVQQKTEPGVQYKIPDVTPPVPVQDAKQEKTIHSTPAGQAGISDAPLTPPDKSGDKNKTVQKKMHNLDITAVDKTWIQIIIDGADKKEMLLNPGEKVNYEANQSIDVLIGNAAGVKLKFNGKEFEGLGEKGQVIKLSLPSTTPQPPQPSNSSNL